MIQIFKPMNLFLIEVVHFTRCNHKVVIKVDDSEPIIERLNSSFIFFTEHEVDKVLVAHLIRLLCFKLSWNFLKDSVHCFT